MVGCGSPFSIFLRGMIRYRRICRTGGFTESAGRKDRESGRRRWKVAIMCDCIKITNFMRKIAQTHEQFL